MKKPIDWSQPLQLRDGRSVRFIGDIRASDARNKLVAVTNPDGFEWSNAVTASGRIVSDLVRHDYDVINVPPSPVWLNLYQLSDGSYSILKHPTQQAADFARDQGYRRIACIPDSGQSV